MALYTYSNCSNERLVKALAIISGILVVALIVIAAFSRSLSSYISVLCDLVLFILFYTSYKLNRIIIDDEKGTITNKRDPNGANSIQISDISYVAYKETRRGIFRSLIVHDTGINFIEIQTSRTNADAIVARLTALNPSVEIQHKGYI